MKTISHAIARARETSTVLEIVRQAAGAQGVARHSYHLSPRLKSQTGKETQVSYAGFSEKWISLYNSSKFRLHDPISDTVLKVGKPMTWFDALIENGESADTRSFFKLLVSHGLIYGIGIPLYGPRARHAYSSFGFNSPDYLQNDELISYLQLIMQAGHLRICELIDKDRPHERIALSEREAQVLTLVAKGHTGATIAQKLDVSKETVATYVDRAATKLGTKGRVSCVVTALSMGLIHL